jgi:hypothetical protein
MFPPVTIERFGIPKVKGLGIVDEPVPPNLKIQ